MAFEHYIRSGQKLLRCGYTTGTCAHAALCGADRALYRALMGTADETAPIPPAMGAVQNRFP